MYELIGCSTHYGVPNKGDGLTECVRILNQRLPDHLIREIPEQTLPEEDLPNLKYLNSITATCWDIAAAVDEVKRRGNTPLFIGGDHAAAIGSVSGDAATESRLGLLWIDAHSDINTDASTITGNIHGMPVSALMGFGNEKLCSVYGEQPKILPENAVLFGLRDVDPLEAEIIERLNVKCYYFSEIMQRGLDTCLDEVKAYLSGIDRLHVSFDLDSMDPAYIKGVSVPVSDGFLEQDVLHIFERVLPAYDISMIDIVEFNPKRDMDGETGAFAERLIRRILSGAFLTNGRI